MRVGRAGLLMAAVSFARSPRGRRMLADARRKFDTPQNRAKVQETVAGMRKGRGPR